VTQQPLRIDAPLAEDLASVLRALGCELPC
jgi:hypothetical protein